MVHDDLAFLVYQLCLFLQLLLLEIDCIFVSVLDLRFLVHQLLKLLQLDIDVVESCLVLERNVLLLHLLSL